MTSTQKTIKYVLVTGGVLSGLGKGIVASSTGVLLQAMDCNVTSIKIDPYLNIDAGTMSPIEHGEVFVLEDGGEVDLDLGNYERFLNTNLSRDCNITTGKIYSTVIEKERRGDYLGKTVQVVPHICNEIQDWIQRVTAKAFANCDSKKPCVCVIELGGTVGDIESMPFVEAMRQFQFRVKRENFCCIHLSLVPVIGVVGEQKTKPTQHTVRELRALGLSPDFIACRSSKPLTKSTKQKLAMFCHVDEEYVLGIPDVKSIYQVPLLLEEQKVPFLLQKRLSLFKDGVERAPNLKAWKEMANKVELLEQKKEGVHIALVGKYTGLADSYLSIIKSLQHASYVVERKLIIDWVNSEHLELSHHEINPNEYEEAWKKVKNANGILVPGGFGDRGTEGKILAIEYARKQKVPYLGICLGMQLAVVEFARNVLKLENANSEEFDPDAKNKIVVYMPEVPKDKKGATMRLGGRVAYFKDLNNKIAALYGFKESIVERHRHRYEINPEIVDKCNAAGLQFVAQDETGKRQEILELKNHPYFVGVQFHPEFKSRPMKASPPFIGLMAAASNQLEKYLPKKEN